MLIGAFLVVTVLFWLGVQTFLGLGLPLMTVTAASTMGLGMMLHLVLAATGAILLALMGALII